MSLTLADFHAISNGTHNVGQIKLSDDGNSLQKINNHVWQTGKNNVLTSAEENRKVRQALYEAFQTAGSYSFERLDEIKDILLGGGNASRSLSRDFVKKLFEKVGDRLRGVSITDDMVRFGKSLSERKILLRDNPGRLAGLVTSSKSAAYEIYANEQMDDIAHRGQEWFGAFVQGFDPDCASTHACFMAGLNGMKKSLCDMVKFDSRIAGRVDEEVVDAKFAEITSDLINTVNSVDTKTAPAGAKDFFIQLAKRKFEQVYRDLGILDVAQDHLDRIFPSADQIRPRSDCFNRQQATMLKELFIKLALNRNFDGLDELPPIKDDGIRTTVRGPKELHERITELILDTATIKNLSGMFQIKLIGKFGELRNVRERSNWLSDHADRSTLLSTVRDDIFDDLEKAFDSTAYLLNDSDVDTLKEMFGCEREDVSVKLTQYFKDELDKLGANLGPLSQYAE